MELHVPQMNNSDLQQAAKLWTTGEALEAGRLIFENLPSKERPRWAAGILKLVLDRSSVEPSLFSRVVTVAENEDLWKQGHQVFDSLRDTTLTFDDLRRSRALTNDEELLASIVLLGELVAKVIYNATNPLDEFDNDSGWYIAAHLRAFVDRWSRDEHFVLAAWMVLTSCQ